MKQEALIVVLDLLNFKQLDIYAIKLISNRKLMKKLLLEVLYSFDHSFLNIKGKERRAHYDYALTHILKPYSTLNQYIYIILNLQY